MGLADEWRTSDEILDEAHPGLAFFAEFLPLYDEAAVLAGRGRWPGLTLAAIQGPFDALRGIDLGAIRADADALSSVAEAAGNHLHSLERHWAGLSGWHGDAADAARAHHERFTGRAAELLRTTAHGPGAITGGATAIQDALVRYAGQVRDLAGDRCGGLTAAELRAARDATVLGNVVDEFDAKKDAFDAYTRAVVRAVQGHYDVLLTHLRPLTGEPAALTVTSDGRIRLTVGARSYELDLGATSPSGVTGPFGEPGEAVAPASGAAATPVSPRLPATLFPWAIRPVERLRPDEDGKVVIHNGKVTITVDPDEVADELTVTLDDGDGHRTTYRLDYRDPANPTLNRAAEPGSPARLAPVRELK
jgi:hypothetical protein